MMRGVAFAFLSIFPDRLAIPVHFLETLEAAGVVLRGVDNVAVVKQVWIGADGPRVDDAALHIEEEGPIAYAEERVAIERLLLVPVEQLRRSLQSLVSKS